MRPIVFHQGAFDDYCDWAKADQKLFDRIRRIIIETTKTTFKGIGKPEPLKNELQDTGRVVSMKSIRLCTKLRISISSSRRASITMIDLT